MQISYEYLLKRSKNGEKSIKNHETKRISAYVKYRLTRLVPNESNLRRCMPFNLLFIYAN